MEFNYKIIGFNNTDIEQYEHNTFTYGEAVKIAHYFREEKKADFAVIIDLNTTKSIYSIG